MSIAVAIDGPAASGKGTIARQLAERFGFGHLDTGLLYRATGHRVLKGDDPVEAARSLRAEDLEGAHLRGADVAQAASQVAALPEVRAALLDFQKAFARRAGGAVLDGRDIGTVIVPTAEVKLYVTANLDERARRRFLELTGRGETTSLEAVAADLEARDARDQARSSAPLKPADDALLLDTTELSIEAAVDKAVNAVEQAMSRVGENRRP